MTTRKRYKTKLRRHKSRRHRHGKTKSFKKKTSFKGISLAKGVSTQCCMCDREFSNKSTMFTPLPCLRRNGFRAHKICDECWWDPQIGFARENDLHKCPGCVRGLPLNRVENKEIVLLSD
jgi:hypothetical protein